MASLQALPAAAAEQHGCSVRTTRLLRPVLSYIGKFIEAQHDGLW